MLIVDDDPQTLRQVGDILTNAHYAPVVTADPAEALSLIETHLPELALLDLMLLGIDGIELMTEIREVSEIRVISLSGYGRDQIIARALQQGASDYVVKRFSPTELMARIHAALRKRPAQASQEPAQSLSSGELSIDYAERAVSLSGANLPLTAAEYAVLRELSLHSGRVLSYQHLLHRIRGIPEADDPRPVRTLGAPSCAEAKGPSAEPGQPLPGSSPVRVGASFRPPRLRTPPPSCCVRPVQRNARD